MARLILHQIDPSNARQRSASWYSTRGGIIAKAG